MTINHHIRSEQKAILANFNLLTRPMENTVLPADQFSNIIQGMVERNEASLVELYDCTLSKVYGLALKITRRHDLAEDVVGDTYWQAWQEAPRFDSTRGPTMAWLMMICRSRAIDALRRLDEAESHPEPQDLVAHEEVASVPLENLLTLERDSALYAAMATLGAIQRQLIALAFFKGLTHEDIAAQMAMPLGSVKSNIKRAQTKLKAALMQDRMVDKE
ncbi:MAG: sigma-70 family RNA polymerase sigma factor [Methylophilaceae bacterium]